MEDLLEDNKLQAISVNTSAFHFGSAGSLFKQKIKIKSKS